MRLCGGIEKCFNLLPVQIAFSGRRSLWKLDCRGGVDQLGLLGPSQRCAQAPEFCPDRCILAPIFSALCNETTAVFDGGMCGRQVAEVRQHVLSGLSHLGYLSAAFHLKLVSLSDLLHGLPLGRGSSAQDQIADFAFGLLGRVCRKTKASPLSIGLVLHDDEAAIELSDSVFAHSCCSTTSGRIRYIRPTRNAGRLPFRIMLRTVSPLQPHRAARSSGE